MQQPTPQAITTITVSSAGTGFTVFKLGCVHMVVLVFSMPLP